MSSTTITSRGGSPAFTAFRRRSAPRLSRRVAPPAVGSLARPGPTGVGGNWLDAIASPPTPEVEPTRTVIPFSDFFSTQFAGVKLGDFEDDFIFGSDPIWLEGDATFTEQFAGLSDGLLLGEDLISNDLTITLDGYGITYSQMVYGVGDFENLAIAMTGGGTITV